MLLAAQLSFWFCKRVSRSGPALHSSSPWTLGGHPRHSQLVARLRPAWPSLQLGVLRLRLQSPAAVRFLEKSAKEEVPAAAQNFSSGSSHGQSSLAESFLHCARDFIPSALRDGSMVTRLVVSTRSSQSSPGSRYDCQWHGCTTRSRPRSRVIHPPRWRIDCVSRGGPQVLFFSSGGFPVQSATGASEHVLRRSSLAYFLEGFSFYAIHPCSRPVLLPGCFVPHLFPARRGFPGIISNARLNRKTHRRAGRELGGGTCWLSDLTPYVNAVSECRWYDFPGDICKDAVEEEGHCMAEQITDSTALANTPARIAATTVQQTELQSLASSYSLFSSLIRQSDNIYVGWGNADFSVDSGIGPLGALDGKPREHAALQSSLRVRGRPVAAVDSFFPGRGTSADRRSRRTGTFRVIGSDFQRGRRQSRRKLEELCTCWTRGEPR